MEKALSLTTLPFEYDNMDPELFWAKHVQAHLLCLPHSNVDVESFLLFFFFSFFL